MERILISACLLGEKCRYDGKSKPVDGVLALASKYVLIPVCPEVMGGLPTPRKPSEIQGDRVIMVDGTDVTAQYCRGAELCLSLARENGCKIAVLKARCPSCGKGAVYDGTYTGTLTAGNGVAAQLLMDNDVTVYDETEINKLEL